MNDNPMNIINQFPVYKGLCDAHINEAVALLATERKLHGGCSGRTLIAVFKDRVAVMSQDTPYNYTNFQTRMVTPYQTVEELHTAILSYSKIPQASCW